MNHFKKLAIELNDGNCFNELKIDPYWPKWKTGWWKALVLFETGHFSLISKGFVESLWEIADAHYIHFFPLEEKELPEHCNPYRNIICHCALGTLVKFACAKKIDLRNEYSWVYDWFLTYQLVDGGYNCDEQAYTKSKKSSILSTIVMLEAALLWFELTKDKKLAAVLEKGAEYFVKHKIFRSLSGIVIDSNWLNLTFPRFYEFDILRGLQFLVNYSNFFPDTIPNSAIEETISLLKKKEDADGNLKTERLFHKEEGTLDFIDGEWRFIKQVYSFPVLDNLPQINDLNPYLTKEWDMCKKWINENRIFEDKKIGLL